MLIDFLVRMFGHNLPMVALLVVGFTVEKHYVSRVTVFTNTIALNVHFLSLSEAPHLLVWYGDLGHLLGLYGLTAYLLNVKTSILYNLPAYSLYSSLPGALVILTGPDGWLVALVLASVVSLVAGYVFEEEFGINVAHWGPRPGQVSRFIQTATLEYVDAYDVHQKVDLDVGFKP
ncbi:hypothetical protein [Halomontanus rarus]|uniref:hypothetical protein n=1 Tax=Halomontanus rarus TaxID=3034020 RepID=UPI0023E80437|nr:hypothetical protein [Halovivax sp. TS33]